MLRQILLVIASLVVRGFGDRTQVGVGGELNLTRSWFQQFSKSFNLTQFLSIRPMDNLFKYGGEMGKHFSVPRYIKVGACDGISDVFLVNFPKNLKSWEVVLVEPVPTNFEALKMFVNSISMTNRTSTINGAVLANCEKSTISINIPIIEERYPNLPHWLRRQLASIHSPNMTEMNERLNYHRQYTGETVRFDRTFDDLYRRVLVPCVPARELTGSWPSLMEGAEAITRASYKKKKRTHVLVVDAEGSDAQVVQAVIHQQVPRALLPLAIFFESKTLNREQVSNTQRALADRGYAFTDFYHTTSDGRADELSNDVFAILLQQQKRLQKKKSTN